MPRTSSASADKIVLPNYTEPTGNNKFKKYLKYAVDLQDVMNSHNVDIKNQLNASSQYIAKNKILKPKSYERYSSVFDDISCLSQFAYIWVRQELLLWFFVCASKALAGTIENNKQIIGLCVKDFMNYIGYETSGGNDEKMVISHGGNQRFTGLGAYADEECKLSPIKKRKSNEGKAVATAAAAEPNFYRVPVHQDDDPADKPSRRLSGLFRRKSGRGQAPSPPSAAERTSDKGEAVAAEPIGSGVEKHSEGQLNSKLRKQIQQQEARLQEARLQEARLLSELPTYTDLCKEVMKSVENFFDKHQLNKDDIFNVHIQFKDLSGSEVWNIWKEFSELNKSEPDAIKKFWNKNVQLLYGDKDVYGSMCMDLGNGCVGVLGRLKEISGTIVGVLGTQDLRKIAMQLSLLLLSSRDIVFITKNIQNKLQQLINAVFELYGIHGIDMTTLEPKKNPGVYQTSIEDAINKATNPSPASEKIERIRNEKVLDAKSSLEMFQSEISTCFDSLTMSISEYIQFIYKNKDIRFNNL